MVCVLALICDFPLSFEIDISSQLYFLKSFNLRPLKPRYFKRLCLFTFNLFSSGKSCLLLFKYMRSLPNIDLCKDARRTFFVPLYNTDTYGRDTFLRVSSKLLNLFVFNFISSSNISLFREPLD